MTASAPLVSVCMPAHRDSSFFRDALASVLAQTLTDFEVIVGDDSGGDLEAAVREAGDDRIRYVPNASQLGFVGNHEATIAAARGRYIAILHDDDRHHPTYLERMVGVLEADPELGLACCDVWEVFPDGRRQRPGQAMPGGRHDEWLHLVFGHEFFIPTSTVLRRSTWEHRTTRHWPDYPVGDIVLWYDAAIERIPMYWVDEALADYRRHDAQISGLLLTRTAVIEINRMYAAPDRPEADLKRKQRLTRGYIGRGGIRLRTGDGRGARADFREASRTAPEIWTRKRQAMSVAASIPFLPRFFAWRTARAGGAGDR